MTNSSAVDAALARALQNASRDLVIRAIREMPRDTKLGQIFESMLHSHFSEAFRNLSLAEFFAIGGIASLPTVAAGTDAPPRAAAATGSQQSHETRSIGGRERLDSAIAAWVQTHQGKKAEDIRAALGGTPQQIRESLTRLMKRGVVKRSGEKRASRYHWVKK